MALFEFGRLSQYSASTHNNQGPLETPKKARFSQKPQAHFFLIILAHTPFNALSFDFIFFAQEMIVVSYKRCFSPRSSPLEYLQRRDLEYQYTSRYNNAS